MELTQAVHTTAVPCLLIRSHTPVNWDQSGIKLGSKDQEIGDLNQSSTSIWHHSALSKPVTPVTALIAKLSLIEVHYTWI